MTADGFFRAAYRDLEDRMRGALSRMETSICRTANRRGRSITC